MTHTCSLLPGLSIAPLKGKVIIITKYYRIVVLEASRHNHAIDECFLATIVTH